jgi:hypothetical protein
VQNYGHLNTALQVKVISIADIIRALISCINDFFCYYHTIITSRERKRWRLAQSGVLDRQSSKLCSWSKRSFSKDKKWRTKRVSQKQIFSHDEVSHISSASCVCIKLFMVDWVVWLNIMFWVTDMFNLLSRLNECICILYRLSFSHWTMQAECMLPLCCTSKTYIQYS